MGAAEPVDPPLPPADPTRYQLHPDACPRVALMANAAVIDTLAVAFHPRRGQPGLRGDLARASGMPISAYDSLQRASAILARADASTTP